MQIIRTIQEMQSISKQWTINGKNIAFVPTMGALHEGHLELMKEAKKNADICIVSIFVNPMQFAPNEDFSKYPRPIEKDMELCISVGVDCLFLPEATEIYPDGFSTTVVVSGITERFEGASRKTHFQGVTTIVAKLLFATNPRAMYMGQKDFQQVLVLQKMVKDLNIDVEIVMVPTKRDVDGLALSSRNKYLSSSERVIALSIRKALVAAKSIIQSGETNHSAIESFLRTEIEKNEGIRIDYATIADASTLEQRDSYNPTETVVLLIATYVGTTRLIDNEVVVIE
jgi:pantoate--beta-alanine ligase